MRNLHLGLVCTQLILILSHWEFVLVNWLIKSYVTLEKQFIWVQNCPQHTEHSLVQNNHSLEVIKDIMTIINCQSKIRHDGLTPTISHRTNTIITLQMSLYSTFPSFGVHTPEVFMCSHSYLKLQACPTKFESTCQRSSQILSPTTTLFSVWPESSYSQCRNQIQQSKTVPIVTTGVQG